MAGLAFSILSKRSLINSLPAYSSAVSTSMFYPEETYISNNLEYAEGAGPSLFNSALTYKPLNSSGLGIFSMSLFEIGIPVGLPTGSTRFLPKELNKLMLTGLYSMG